MKKLINLFSIAIVLIGGNAYSQCAGCPTVNAQIGTGPTPNICLGQSVTLTASNTPILGANTSSYAVASIPYAPQPYAGGAVAVQNCDDCWGSVQNLPFTFCFFGNAFNQFVVGSNGMTTFNPAMANGWCAWPIPGPWPNIAGCGTGNVIGIPWRDINMGPNSSSARWYVSGVMPFRTLVIYYTGVPLYSCGNPQSFLQLILYESTQVVEIHIQNSSACGWNNAAGIVGIQNATGLTGVIPPARNYPPGGWTAINEAWRFSPSPAVPSWTWTGPGGVVATGTTAVIVSPTVTTTYSAYCVAGCPPGTVQVVVNTPPTLNLTANTPICQGSNLNLQAGGGGVNTTYTWTGPAAFTSSVQNPVLSNAQPSNTGVYSLTAANNFTAGPSCPNSGTVLAQIVPVNQVTVTPTFTLCQGQNLNLTAQNAVPPTGYQWTGPAPFTSTLQNPIILSTNPTHSGNYSVVATFSTPGIALTCTSGAVTNVSIVATSQLTMTVPQNICEHATAVLNVTANPMPLNFDWTGPNGFLATGSNTSIVDISPAATGVYVVVATWAIGTKSCTISSNNVINVVPVAPISINASTMVCYPANVQLTANSPGAISYTWTATNGYTSNLPNPLLGSPSTSATGIYTVRTAYTNGALICYNTNTTQVTVNPILPFTLEPYRQVCFNSTYTLSGPSGATSYSWIGPNAFTSTNQILGIAGIQPPFAGTYTLELMLGPCKTTGTTKIDVLTPISFSLTPGNKVICRGDQVNLIMGATGGSHNYAYVWNPQQWLASPTGSTNTGKPEGTTIYNVTGYDIACPFYTISTAFTVTVNRAPIPQLELEKYEGCQPLCLKYDTKTQADASLVTYDFGDGNVLQSDNFTYCLEKPGTYNLKILTKGKNGCIETFEQPAPIVVNPLPLSEFVTNPEVVTTTQNNVTFEPSAQYGPIVSYLWMFSGTTKAPKNGYDTSGTKNPTRIFDNVGKFATVLISKTDKGCIDTITKVIEVVDEFTIYLPNTFTPNGDNLNDVFNVKGVGVKSEGYSMDIYDRWGTLIYSTKDVYKGWDGTVKGLFAENGVYVYKVKALGANGEGKKEYVGHVTLLK